MKTTFWSVVGVAVMALSLLAGTSFGQPGAKEPPVSDYVVVVSRATQGQEAWRKVVDALVARHQGTVITYDDKVAEALPALKKALPRYACFVARPGEATRQFVADVHLLTRQFDEDPYTDVLWGIVTGHDAASAMKLVAPRDPLVVKKAASGTEIALDQCVEGIWYSELQAGLRVRKKAEGSPQSEKGPTDTTKLLAEALTKEQADLFVTSGHATERDWQIGFRYKNGSFRSKDGALFGVDNAGQRFAIESDHPRVYLAVGNCLMGHIDGPDAMALAFMKSAGVRQMIGYTVLTWYGYAGWGCLDYYVEQPGRYTLAEAFFANQQALQHRLSVYHPEGMTMKVAPGSKPAQPLKLSPEARAAKLTLQDIQGLIHDRDVLAFYGDPAFETRMAPGECAWDQKLTEKNGRFTLEITPRRGAKTFEPINTNGSQRGYRPIVAMLPYRVQGMKVIEGQELQPLVKSTFVLIPNPKTCDESKAYRVVFEAQKAK